MHIQMKELKEKHLRLEKKNVIIENIFQFVRPKNFCLSLRQEASWTPGML